ncbi:hypothetical protein ABIE51_003730 [Lysobacter sp. OAE881]|uniref:EF-hand domain-containing protein n=1 Tax=Lysobacter sp. OAE881 TaxID=2663813 RepID=UPI0033933B78
MPIATSRFGYPFKDKDDREIVDPYAFIEALIPVQGGHYLLGSYGFFHGGIHLDRACSSKLSIDDGIRCLADGEVVAYRIDSEYHDATPGAVGDGAPLRPYSTGFVLVRHRLQAPSPPMPATPPPMDTPGADIRDWGTRLYADPQGRQPLAWLRHGTPLIVQVGAYTPGQSTLVRVTDTLDSKLPREGWISRTHLALDPATGTGMRSAFGLKDSVSTTVYRGDSIDPDKSAAHAENKAQRQRPEPETAPVLTLYSLYMHVASERDYERNAKWTRPSWWPERGGSRKPEATDRVVALAKPLPIRQGDLIGYLGEDVPAHAYPVAGQPVTKRLLHLEVFSGDDVPAYLANSRRWAKEYLPDSERTLLLLMPGDTLQRDLGGPAAATVNQRQIVRVAGLESRTVEGKRWRKVTLGMTQGHATGWIEEEGRLVSPWEWPGFEVQDEIASPDGFRHDDPDAFADYLRGDGPRPPDTPFYKALRSLVDRNHDGSLSEEELDRLLRNRHHADHLTRLIVRHETAWTRTSMRRRTETARRIAAKLGPAAVENVNAEEPRGEKLPWWEDVAASVEGFPASSRVWHFHAGGVAGNFPPVERLVTYRIHQSDGRIERVIPSGVSYPDASRIKYVYLDAGGAEHDLGTYEFLEVTSRGPGNVIVPGRTKLMNQRDVRNYANGAVRYGFHYDMRLTYRPYIKDLALASLLGAMLEVGYEDISCNGFSDDQGRSIGGSVSHYDGTNGDFKYLRADGTTQSRSSLHIDLSPDDMDEVRQTAFVEALYKFGWKAMLSWPYRKHGQTRMLPHSSSATNHNHHLHIQRYSPNVVDVNE